MSSVHAQHALHLRQQAEAAGLVWPEAAPDAALEPLAKSAGLTDAALLAARAKTLGLEHLPSLEGRAASAVFIEHIDIHFARRHRVLGLAGVVGAGAGVAALEPGEAMPLAVADSEPWAQAEVIARTLERPVQPVLVPEEAILAAINLAYQQRRGQASRMIEQLEPDAPQAGEPGGDVQRQIDQLAAGGGREDLLDVATRAPVIKLVNLILFEAVKQLASDVHIQPSEEKLVVRFRIDGVLFDAYALPGALREEVASRIKIMGKMNIAEKRLAQDGRATVQVGDRVIDLRLASLPTSFGERLVIRLLDKSARLYTLGELGMDGRTLERFREMIGVEHGLILVTGPTGSGKSTTLYAALQELNGTELNILTLEDPIEYQLPGVSQTQISGKKGMTFASGLRHVLRQDPDIIMVGEIRDRETAVMAIQSALTGHLVFSTLHTNDAASAVTRLLDLGIEPYLAASSLVGVLAQRLVRRICPHCRQSVPADLKLLERLELTADELDGIPLQRGGGCEACRGTGYLGRTGLFELLTVSDPVRQQVQQRGTAAQIKQAAAAQGMQSLHDSGLTRIRSGLTTIEEVLRVTMRATK